MLYGVRMTTVRQRSSAAWLLWAAAGLAVLTSSPALAGGTDQAFCERARASAASDASLLLAPRVSLQAIRVPSERSIDPAELFGENSDYQLRAFVSYSLANAWAGKLTLDLAEAECQRQAAQAALSEAVRTGTDHGAIAALRAALGYLDENRALVERIRKQAEVRHARQLTNVMQLDDVRGLSLQLERKHLEMTQELQRLERNQASDGNAPLGTLVSSYERASADYEDSAASLRRVRRWDVSIRAGVIPAPEVDYYGAIELSYNLGDLFQAAAESRYLAARKAELREARYELPNQAVRLEEQLAASDELLRKELELREGELRWLEQQMGLLEQSETPEKPHLMSIAELRRLLLQTNIIYTRELLGQHGAWTAGRHD